MRKKICISLFLTSKLLKKNIFCFQKIFFWWKWRKHVFPIALSRFRNYFTLTLTSKRSVCFNHIPIEYLQRLNDTIYSNYCNVLLSDCIALSDGYSDEVDVIGPKVWINTVPVHWCVGKEVLFHRSSRFRCFALSPHSSKRLTSALIQTHLWA